MRRRYAPVAEPRSVSGKPAVWASSLGSARDVRRLLPFLFDLFNSIPRSSSKLTVRRKEKAVSRTSSEYTPLVGVARYHPPRRLGECLAYCFIKDCSSAREVGEIERATGVGEHADTSILYQVRCTLLPNC